MKITTLALEGSFSNAPRDTKTLNGVELKVGLKGNAALRRERNAERGKLRQGLLQQLSARKVRKLIAHFFPHP